MASTQHSTPTIDRAPLSPPAPSTLPTQPPAPPAAASLPRPLPYLPWKDHIAWHHMYPGEESDDEEDSGDEHNTEHHHTDQPIPTYHSPTSPSHNETPSNTHHSTNEYPTPEVSSDSQASNSSSESDTATHVAPPPQTPQRPILTHPHKHILSLCRQRRFGGRKCYWIVNDDAINPLNRPLRNIPDSHIIIAACYPDRYVGGYLWFDGRVVGKDMVVEKRKGIWGVYLLKPKQGIETSKEDQEVLEREERVWRYYLEKARGDERVAWGMYDRSWERHEGVYRALLLGELVEDDEEEEHPARAPPKNNIPVQNFSPVTAATEMDPFYDGPAGNQTATTATATTSAIAPDTHRNDNSDPISLRLRTRDDFQNYRSIPLAPRIRFQPQLSRSERIINKRREGFGDSPPGREEKRRRLE
ncbi:hypothetical protein B0T20DRAFT_390712 [Sordaria brevicollis]|uniref:Uncharacterized protein n=1 Tax=Sordaria brevicollis TaxID=83679 RepID=A0AAE0UEV6_SORBR|nr:hypothetical protein B0T20DRAFT_390712 [Sordaria brevicollis]